MRVDEFDKPFERKKARAFSPILVILFSWLFPLSLIAGHLCVNRLHLSLSDSNRVSPLPKEKKMSGRDVSGMNSGKLKQAGMEALASSAMAAAVRDYMKVRGECIRRV